MPWWYCYSAFLKANGCSIVISVHDISWKKSSGDTQALWVSLAPYVGSHAEMITWYSRFLFIYFISQMMMISWRTPRTCLVHKRKSQNVCWMPSCAKEQAKSATRGLLSCLSDILHFQRACRKQQAHCMCAWLCYHLQVLSRRWLWYNSLYTTEDWDDYLRFLQMQASPKATVLSFYNERGGRCHSQIILVVLEIKIKFRNPVFYTWIFLLLLSWFIPQGASSKNS